jgi:GT2 family glycosyltransferase
MLAKRTAFDCVGLFDSTRKYSDSADWFLRANAAGLRIRLLPDLLTLHRQHGDNLSVTHGDQSRQEFLQLIKAKIDRERGRSSRSGDHAKPAAKRE